MRRISDRVKKKLLDRPNKCQRGNSECKGHITWEHALIYAGRQIDEAWAIVKLCEYHHGVNSYQDGGDLRKEVNVWIALNQAEIGELDKYSKAINYRELRKKLNKKYGYPRR